MSHSPAEQPTVFPDSEARSRAEDRLKFAPIARSICTEIERWNRSHSGLAIGVYGPWGSGKTSLMRLVQFMLDGKDQPSSTSEISTSNATTSTDQLSSSGECFTPTRKYLSIWFSAWHYDKRDDVWIALLRVILQGIAGRLTHRQRFDLYRKLWRSRIDPPMLVVWILALLFCLAIFLILTTVVQPSSEASSVAFGYRVKDVTGVVGLIVLILGFPQYIIKPIRAVSDLIYAENRLHWIA